MKKIVIISAIIIVILLIALIILLATNKEQGNTNNVNNNTNTSVSFLERDDSIMINFSKCDKTIGRRIDVEMGSTTFEIKGVQEGKCLMNFGGEVEDPGWDGALNYVCKIPTIAGEMTFAKASLGVDFSSIAKYCKNSFQTTCNTIRDAIECLNRADCLSIDLCNCTTDGERAEKCGGTDNGCLCEQGGFIRCEDLDCS